MTDSNIVEPTMPPLPPGVQYHHEPDTDTITWVNKDVPLSILNFVTLFIGWALFMTGAILIDYNLFTKGIKTWPLTGQLVVVYMFLGFNLIVILLPSVLQGLLWRVTIKISNKEIIFTQSVQPDEGWFFSKLKLSPPKEQIFKKGTVLGLSFDRNSYRGTYVVPSLKIKYRASLWGFVGYKHEKLALWMKEKEQYRLFLFMQTILETRGWNIKFNDIYENSIWL